MSRIVSKRSSSLDAMQEDQRKPKTQRPRTPKESKDEKAGRLKFTFYLEPDMHEELRRISYEKRIKIQKILEEGLDRWLTAHGEPTYATLKRRRETKEAA